MRLPGWLFLLGGLLHFASLACLKSGIQFFRPPAQSQQVLRQANIDPTCRPVRTGLGNCANIFARQRRAVLLQRIQHHARWAALVSVCQTERQAQPGIAVSGVLFGKPGVGHNGPCGVLRVAGSNRSTFQCIGLQRQNSNPFGKRQGIGASARLAQNLYPI